MTLTPPQQDALSNTFAQNCFGPLRAAGIILARDNTLKIPSPNQRFLCQTIFENGALATVKDTLLNLGVNPLVATIAGISVTSLSMPIDLAATEPNIGTKQVLTTLKKNPLQTVRLSSFYMLRQSFSITAGLLPKELVSATAKQLNIDEKYAGMTISATLGGMSRIFDNEARVIFKAMSNPKSSSLKGLGFGKRAAWSLCSTSPAFIVYATAVGQTNLFLRKNFFSPN